LIFSPFHYIAIKRLTEESESWVFENFDIDVNFSLFTEEKGKVKEGKEEEKAISPCFSLLSRLLFRLIITFIFIVLGQFQLFNLDVFC